MTLSMRDWISAKLLSCSGSDGSPTPATRAAPSAWLQPCRTCRSNGNMSGKKRKLSTTAVSHFWVVAWSSAFLSTVLRPVSNCTQTGTNPLYNVTAMRCSFVEVGRTRRDQFYSSMIGAQAVADGPPASRAPHTPCGSADLPQVHADRDRGARDDDVEAVVARRQSPRFIANKFARCRGRIVPSH